MAADRKAPPVDPQLVDWLSSVFPDRCPDPKTDSDREVWFNAGSAHVVRRLQSLVKHQLEDNLQ